MVTHQSFRRKPESWFGWWLGWIPAFAGMTESEYLVRVLLRCVLCGEVALFHDVGNSLKTTKRARRFLTRHSSVCSKQAGASLP